MTIEDGLAGGDSRHHETVIAACRALHAADAPVSLDTLSAASGLSSTHFQRLFRSRLGVTPRQYASHLQRERAQVALGRAPRITDAVLEAGFDSPSRFYERARAMLGMSPSAWRDGGRGVEIDYAITDTTLGPLLVAATDLGVCRVAFGEVQTARDETTVADDPAALLNNLQRRFPNASLSLGGSRFQATIDAVAACVSLVSEARQCIAPVPLDIEGTLFQSQVWRVLQGIPAGKTMTYAEVATAMGKPGAHRAVANACGANPVALLIPCHRVTRTGGALGGYRWGVGRKRTLLANEGGAPRQG